MTFDCDPLLKRAIGIRAAATGIGPSELIGELLTRELGAEIEQARRFMAEHPPQKSPRGRKPKQ